MINKSNIGEITIEEKDFKITIKQKEEHVTQVLSAPVQACSGYTQLHCQQRPPASCTCCGKT